MTATIYNALLSLNPTASSLESKCITGNCTFEPFGIIGFCSECRDITTDITPDCHTECNLWGTTWSNCTFPLRPGYLGAISTSCLYQLIPEKMVSERAGVCNLTLQLSRDLWIGPGDDQFAPISAKNMSFANLQLNLPFRNFTDIADPDREIPDPEWEVLGSIGGLNFSDAFLGFGRAIQINNLAPFEDEIVANITACTLSLCVQTLDTNINNGIIYQNALSSNETLRSLVWKDANGSEPNFHVDSTILYALADGLNPILEGSLSTKPSKDPDDVSAFAPSSEIAKALWQVENLNDYMGNLADRMTDAVRNQPQGDQVSGTAWRTEIYVSVKWQWLALPVALVLLSCALLLVSIISNSRQHVTAWKSNVLATLFHGIGLGSRDDRVAHMVHAKQMERAAEGIYVQLEKDDGGDVYLSRSRQVGSDEHAKTGLYGCCLYTKATLM